MSWKNIFITIKTATSNDLIVLSESTKPTRMLGPMPTQNPSISQSPPWSKGRTRVIPNKTRVPERGLGVSLVPETGVAKIPRPIDRICRFEGCEQQLSIYNRNKMCFMHMTMPTNIQSV